MEFRYIAYKWGGLLEELSKLEGFETLLQSREDLRNYIHKLYTLEQSKTVKDARRIVASFSVLDRNYLNSILLDHLSETNKRYSWLKWACRKGYLDVIHFLTERGTQLFPDKMLKIACRSGQIAIVKFYLERGAEIDDEHFIIARKGGYDAVMNLLHETCVKRLLDYTDSWKIIK